MTVARHTWAMRQMTSALRSSEVTSQFADLTAPTALDKAYLDLQKLAHREPIFLHEGYAEGGDNPQLRSPTRGGLPMVERHRRAFDRLGVH